MEIFGVNGIAFLPRLFAHIVHKTSAGGVASSVGVVRNLAPILNTPASSSEVSASSPPPIRHPPYSGGGGASAESSASANAPPPPPLHSNFPLADLVSMYANIGEGGEGLMEQEELF